MPLHPLSPAAPHLHVAQSTAALNLQEILDARLACALLSPFAVFLVASDHAESHKLRLSESQLYFVALQTGMAESPGDCDWLRALGDNSLSTESYLFLSQSCPSH